MGQSQASRELPSPPERVGPIGYVDSLAVIGSPPEHRDFRWKYLAGELTYRQPYIDPSAIIEAFATVDGGITKRTWIGPRVFLMKHSHVGHDSVIGPDTNVAPGAIIGGHCIIGSRVKIGLGASIRPRVIVGDGAVIGAGAVVVKDVPDGEIWAGNPARRIPRPRDVEGTELDPWMEWYYSWHPDER